MFIYLKKICSNENSGDEYFDFLMQTTDGVTGNIVSQGIFSLQVIILHYHEQPAPSAALSGTDYILTM